MYAIEVLPVHPQPQPLETLTSYVMRLAEANGLQKVAGFAQLLKVKYTVPRWNDLPVKDWGYLPELAQCPVDRLNQTTLYHLGYKFHRKLGPSFSKFVVGTLSPHRRYCSQCLAETGYDRLPWRFLQLRGCPEHQCLLLESCPHCKENLPLLVSPLRLWACPYCARDLRDVHAPELNDINTNQQVWDELVYLIWQCDIRNLRAIVIKMDE